MNMVVRPQATVTRETDLRLRVTYSNEEGSTVHVFDSAQLLLDYHIDELMPRLREDYTVKLVDAREEKDGR